MKIQLSSVFQQIGKEQFYEVLPEFNEINGYPIVKKEDIRLCVTPVDSIHFTVSSEGQVELLIPCDRCLKDVNTIVPFSFFYKVDQNKGTDEDGEAVLFLEDVGELRVAVAADALHAEDLVDLILQDGEELVLGLDVAAVAPGVVGRAALRRNPPEAAELVDEISCLVLRILTENYFCRGKILKIKHESFSFQIE